MALAESTKTKINNIFKTAQHQLVNLYSRWLDERAYEDIADYAKAIAPTFEALGATIYKTSKKPFGFYVKVDGQSFLLYVKSTTYGWKQIL